MVEGIDKLGQSLLARQDTFRQQREDDIKKQRRRAKTQALLGGVLKFADNIAREKYDNWFGNESSRAVSGLLKKQKQFISDREQYEKDWRKSGKTKLDYEISLVEKELTEDKLAKYFPGFADYSTEGKRTVMYGSGAAYDPSTDNYSAAGLINTVAKQRLDAREEWGKALKNLDVEGQINSWKKLNPNSKNLPAAALNIFKRTFGNEKRIEEDAVQSKFDEISKDTAQLEKLYNLRAAGFDINTAINKLSESENIKGLEKIGTVISSKVVEKDVFLPSTVPGGSPIKTKTPVVETIRQLNDGNIVPFYTAITEGSPQEVAASKRAVSLFQQVGEQKRTIIDKDLGIAITATVTGQVNSETGAFVPGTEVYSYDNAEDQTAALQADDPSIANLTNDQREGGFQEWSTVSPNVVYFNENKFNTALAAPTDSIQYKQATKTIGAKQLLTKKNLRQQLEDYQFSENVLSKLAAQVNMIDGFTGRLDLGQGDSNLALKGDSYTQSIGSGQEIEPAKIALAADLLLRNRAFSGSDNPQIRAKFERFIKAESEGSFDGNQGGTPYFDSFETEAIAKIINKALEVGSPGSGLLEREFTTSLKTPDGKFISMPLSTLITGDGYESYLARSKPAPTDEELKEIQTVSNQQFMKEAESLGEEASLAASYIVKYDPSAPNLQDNELEMLSRFSSKPKLWLDKYKGNIEGINTLKNQLNIQSQRAGGVENISENQFNTINAGISNRIENLNLLMNEIKEEITNRVENLSASKIKEESLLAKEKARREEQAKLARSLLNTDTRVAGS